MVATWNPAADATYYTHQTGYYLSGREPAGLWYAPAGDFGIGDGTIVDREVFEHLFAGLTARGRPLISNVGGRRDRTPAFDVTFSAPRSVSIVWALGDASIKTIIEKAQLAAVRRALDMLEREACWARRGNGGTRIERVPLTAAVFQHGESRPAQHSDGSYFADMNLHHHAVILNISTRSSDHTIGALASTILRDAKMCCGAYFHAAFACELQAAGFTLDRIGRNGIFEIAGVQDSTIRYFSARRAEIEAELAEAGTTSTESVSLAATVARSTRSAKLDTSPQQRDATWKRAAREQGLDIETFVHSLRNSSPSLDKAQSERLLAERIATLPRQLTETRSVIDRRELLRSVAEALVGTGVRAERVDVTVRRLIDLGHVIRIGEDALGFPRYSTPEMIKIEREIVAIALELSGSTAFKIDLVDVRRRCEIRNLSAEQTDAVLVAAGPERLAIMEGAPGTGKTTSLSPIVGAWKGAGFRVLGAASAWRIANTLRDDLAIESRAIASWIAKIELGLPVFDERTVLVVDEAGLLSSRDMHTLIGAVRRAGSKLLLVGDRGQLPALGAGSGLSLAAQAVKACRVENIVRQREPWMRDAVVAFGRGHAAIALEAFAEHGRLVETDGQAATTKAVVDVVQNELVRRDPGSAIILAKTNAEIASLSREVRSRLKQLGIVRGDEVIVDTVTPSGHHTHIMLATGDRIRFLARNDTVGVINGSTATVLRVLPDHQTVKEERTRHARLEIALGGRTVTCDTRDLADANGFARLSWAYASTIYGSQGITVERAAVLVTPSFDRHDIYVAASRTRGSTYLVVNNRTLDLPHVFAAARRTVTNGENSSKIVERRAALAAKLSRANVKETTVDVILAAAAQRTVERDNQSVGSNLASSPGVKKTVAERRHEIDLGL